MAVSQHLWVASKRLVFRSYRRTNAPWALAVFKDLTSHGYDVFFDFTGLASDDFEILENIRARVHFIVLLTPSALEACSRPDDRLRRLRSRRPSKPDGTSCR